LGTDQSDVQRRLARKIIEQDLSVRATEKLVRQITQPHVPKQKHIPKQRGEDANVRAAETKLRRKFGTQVRIVEAAAEGAGRIELEFYNATDLDRLYTLLMAAT
jgi:ParB family transcriptional regulator, chromosome partitioning protein